MGVTGTYRRARTVVVDFGPEHAREDMRGFQVELRRLSVDEQLDLESLQTAAVPADGDAAAVRKATVQLMDFVVQRVVSWNLADDDGPIAPSVAALLAEDLGFLDALITEWLESISGVSPPLSPSSSAGALSELQALPMDAL